ncbi:putative uncharacterized protein [Parachlamydia acanthamoebae UV-7]|uniref:Uncharacterized protein n=2 Tax=Parachlamydia acanthamoebae TaxID=83552 RepID=F8KXW3_PARAV|nr:putative Na+/H+ antiporter [Parachlamydia acanthamoebae]CCB85693.1 putative uncharacterized protein [Parachlamydia acanthamoebae UV-7]
MKWLCLVLVATAKAALLDAQEAITSTPWISDSEEGFFSCHRYEETSSDSLGQGFPDSSEMTSLSITANILLGIALVYNFLSRKVLALPDNWQKEQATEQTVVLTHSKNPLKYLSHYIKTIRRVFGIWIIPLVASITFLYDWKAAINFLNTRNYTEALFISVIMTIASSHPIMNLAESFIRKVASLGKESPGAWWVSLLTIGPILGAVITEAGAMIVTCLLLAKQFYTRPVSQKLAYATLGLLFTHISLGAIMTNFCTPVDWMHAEQLGEEEILTLVMFSWKSLLAIFTSTICYYLYFRDEFAELAKKEQHRVSEIKNSVPWWVTATHAICLIGTILCLYHPTIFICITCLFLVFHEITHPYQTRLKLRPPMLVGFFFSGLVIHGGLQEWWITPLLERVDALMLTGASYMFGSFIDGATLTYLATLLPSLNDATKYSVIVGTLAAGGLTVIGHPLNSEKDTPQNSHFSEGISPKKLFCAALFPMFVTASIFFIFRV